MARLARCFIFFPLLIIFFAAFSGCVQRGYTHGELPRREYDPVTQRWFTVGPPAGTARDLTYDYDARDDW